MEVSELYYLVDCAVVAAANLLAIPQANGRRRALLRSYTLPALDNVDTLFWPDCGFTLRNARGTAGLKKTRCALTRPRAGRNRAINHGSVTAKTFRGSSPIFRTIDTKRLSSRRGANSGAIPIKCNDDECSSHARCSSRIASSYSSNTTCTCAIASPG